MTISDRLNELMLSYRREARRCLHGMAYLGATLMQVDACCPRRLVRRNESISVKVWDILQRHSMPGHAASVHGRVVQKAACTSKTAEPPRTLQAAESRQNGASEWHPDPAFQVADFPTVSYRKCWLESVRLDLTEARKGSSYAKHCILLIAFAVEIGSEKIPLPAPAFSGLISVLLPA